MLEILRRSRGVALAVDDREMIESAAELATREGIDACPEGGAALAAVGRLARSKVIAPDDRVVMFNTGTGLKYFS